MQVLQEKDKENKVQQSRTLNLAFLNLHDTLLWIEQLIQLSFFLYLHNTLLWIKQQNQLGFFLYLCDSLLWIKQQTQFYFVQDPYDMLIQRQLLTSSDLDLYQIRNTHESIPFCRALQIRLGISTKFFLITSTVIFRIIFFSQLLQKACYIKSKLN